MTATVVLTTWEGMIPAAVASHGGQKVENAVWLLKQPYLAGEALSITDSEATASGDALAVSPSVKLLRVEVQTGKRVRYEMTPFGQDGRTATASSPVLYGDETLAFGVGWKISLIEAT